MNNKCYVLVGLPACGKTTWVTKNFPIGAHVCSTDNIIEDIAYEYATTYNAIFKNAIGLAEQLFWKRIEYGRTANMKNIIIDRTNLSRKSRRKIMNALPGYEFHAVVFPIPEHGEWERRLNSRPGKSIPSDAIQSMMQRYEEPLIQEGFTSVSLYDVEVEKV